MLDGAKSFLQGTVETFWTLSDCTMHIHSLFSTPPDSSEATEDHENAHHPPKV
jgi:hypothetical protein